MGVIVKKFNEEHDIKNWKSTRQFYDLIYDPIILENFYEDFILPTNLKDNEVYQVSLSARKKDLTEEEREFYYIGSKEMFECQVFKNDKIDFLSTIYGFERNKFGFLTKNNIPFPEKAMCVYFNINPRDSIKAFQCLQDEILELTKQFTIEYVKGKTNEEEHKRLMKRVRYVTEHGMMRNYAKATSRKLWTDVDVDFEESYSETYKSNFPTFNTDTLIKSIEHHFEDYLKLARIFIIYTKSGFHLLFENKGFSPMVNPPRILKVVKNQIINDLLNEDKTILIKEIVDNSENSMIPLPGTIQRGFKVNYDKIDLRGKL